MNIRSLLLLAPATLALASCSSSSNTNGSQPSSTPVATTIGQIQGNGSASPLLNSAVSVSGIVTGDFQNNDADVTNNLGGFFLQSATPDSDPSTSEGIFVSDFAAVIDVAVGDAVLVEGTVREHQGETRLVASTVAVDGTGSVQPVDVNLPADLESYEGMLIRLPQTMLVAGLFELERFGTLHLVAGNRPFSFTNQNLPDVGAYAAHQSDFASRSIFLDDGTTEQNVVPIRYLPTTLNSARTIRGGDTIAGLTGNLRFGRGDDTNGSEGFRIMPTVEPVFDMSEPRPELPARTGSVRIAGFNALNFFSTIDTGADECGPARTGGCRGADSNAEQERQLGKLTSTLHQLDADIIGLNEVENNGGPALQMIVDRLNSVSGDIYDFIDTGTIGTGVISNALIYRTSSVSPLGDFVLLDSTTDPRFNGFANRHSLAQSFAQNSDGAVVSVVVNHLKSKGSDCDDAGDPDRNDGQGDCNQTRSQAAAALADWVANDPTNSGDSDYLVIGDFNSFVFEDPLTTLSNGGLTNLLQANVGGETYSSVFRGEYGALDHAFATTSLTPQVRAAVDWHINADEPMALDYNLESGRDPTLFDDATPFRSSDHDPIVVDLELVH